MSLTTSKHDLTELVLYKLQQQLKVKQLTQRQKNLVTAFVLKNTMNKEALDQLQSMVDEKQSQDAASSQLKKIENYSMTSRSSSKLR
jgi:hypothetical protein